MLPSMPLISTPLKDLSGDMQGNETINERDVALPITSAVCQTSDDSSACNKVSAVCGTTKILDARSVSPSPKKLSPLKHVTPILKKYHRKGNKVPLLVKGNSIELQHVEKQNLQPIAPKPVMVVISTPPATFAAVPHIPSTEISASVRDNLVCPSETAVIKLPDEPHVKQCAEEPAESQGPELIEESPSAQEKKITEQPEKKRDLFNSKKLSNEVVKLGAFL